MFLFTYTTLAHLIHITIDINYYSISVYAYKLIDFIPVGTTVIEV